jgi:hypothetical protein
LCNDLTDLAWARRAIPRSSLDGYQITAPDQQHINCIWTDSHVYELAYECQWLWNDLGFGAAIERHATGSPR